MPAIDDDISHEIALEGGTTLTNNPADAGGRTIYGISEKSNPDLWVNGPPSEAKARQRFMDRYVVQPGFDKVADPQLQAQLIDFGVTSGPAVAITKLQEVIGGLKADGVLGSKTLAALVGRDARKINNSLVCARVNMICKLVGNDRSQLTFLLGWCRRACEFISPL